MNIRKYSLRGYLLAPPGQQKSIELKRGKTSDIRNYGIADGQTYRNYSKGSATMFFNFSLSDATIFGGRLCLGGDYLFQNLNSLKTYLV